MTGGRPRSCFWARRRAPKRRDAHRGTAGPHRASRVPIAPPRVHAMESYFQQRSSAARRASLSVSDPCTSRAQNVSSNPSTQAASTEEGSTAAPRVVSRSVNRDASTGDPKTAASRDGSRRHGIEPCWRSAPRRRAWADPTSLRPFATSSHAPRRSHPAAGVSLDEPCVGSTGIAATPSRISPRLRASAIVR